MTIPTEQQVIALMGAGSSATAVEEVAELLRKLGYPDVAKELLAVFDGMQWDGEDDLCCGFSP